jgi:Zn-dependent protease
MDVKHIERSARWGQRALPTPFQLRDLGSSFFNLHLECPSLFIAPPVDSVAGLCHSAPSFMDIFGSGIPLGRYFGINVRLHWTFLLYAYWRASEWGNWGYGLAFVLGIYFCILLHEFGHSLAARWCDGEANDILLWPLGGLAFVRPAFHPTAHLITAAAGPFVTLVLAMALWWAARLAGVYLDSRLAAHFLLMLSVTNWFLLVFNLIPAFPMDGGRILRDTLWHWMSLEKATTIAIWVSRVFAFGLIGFALVPLTQGEGPNFMLLLIGGFVLLQGARERAMVAYESSAVHHFSIRDRIKRGRRQRAFRQAVTELSRTTVTSAFHRCAVCGRTENDVPTLDFRVCSDCANGEEYCQEHLENHKHV